jgi:hypothetical protein
LGETGMEIFLQTGLDSNSVICPTGARLRLRVARMNVVPVNPRDPYAADSRLGKVANAFCSNRLQGLWVPAFAGTTVVGTKP